MFKLMSIVASLANEEWNSSYSLWLGIRIPEQQGCRGLKRRRHCAAAVGRDTPRYATPAAAGLDRTSTCWVQESVVVGSFETAILTISWKEESRKIHRDGVLERARKILRQYEC
jgi:hypothetical protein